MKRLPDGGQEWLRVVVVGDGEARGDGHDEHEAPPQTALVVVNLGSRYLLNHRPTDLRLSLS